MHKIINGRGTTLDEALNLNNIRNSFSEIILREGVSLFKEVHVTANNTTVNANVLQVFGACRVIEQYAIITEVTALTNMTNVYADVWDGTVAVPLTKTPGNTFSGLLVGAFFTKDLDATNIYSVINSDQGNILEREQKNIGYPFIVNQKNGADTFIRLNFTTNTALDFKLQIYFKYEKINSGHLTFL